MGRLGPRAGAGPRRRAHQAAGRARDASACSGAGIVGVGAGELIAETVHALEMGANAEDLALTIHPHPTLSETVVFAAEMAEGTITDLMRSRQRAAR